MQHKRLSRTSGSVLEENLQSQARALGPLFITFDTEQARLIYPRDCICSSRAFPAPKTTGLGRGATEMRALAVSKSSRSRHKGQAIFHQLRMGFSCPAEPGRKEHSQHFPRTGGVSCISTLLSSQVTEAFLSCVCWLLHHPPFTSPASMESWNILNGKGPTRIPEIQLLALHRTTQQSHRGPESAVPTLPGLCHTWGCDHSLAAWTGRL